MQRLIYALLPCIFLLDFLRLEFKIPQALLFLPELLSGLALLLIMGELARTGRIQLAGKYVLLITVLLLTVAFGLVVSEATTGPIVGGLRLYGKYLVFFLLPIVFVVTESNLKVQLLAVLGFMLVQLPIVLLQRFVLYTGQSGDAAKGTMSTGSMMSVVLLFGVSVIVAMYHQGYLSRWRALLIGLLVAIPPMLAEAKGAFLLLPLAILLPGFYAPVLEGRGRGARAVLSVAICVGGLAIFSLLYSLAESTNASRAESGGYRTSVVEFFRNPSLVLDYMAPQLSGHERDNRVGRLDGVAAPITEFWGDASRMVSGLGVGAITDSPIDVFSSDQHKDIVDTALVEYVAMARLLWEFGFFGTGLILLAYFAVWRDARRLSEQRSLEGALALAWVAVVPIYLAAMFWKNVIANNTIMYLFVYFSGVVVAAAYRSAREQSFVEQVPIPEDDQEASRVPKILNVGAMRSTVSGPRRASRRALASGVRPRVL